MTTEEDSIDQASSARRERLEALRAAKEYLSTPDDGPDQDESKGEGPVDGHGDKKAVAVEEDLIEQAAAARRERLKALRTAKELLDMPDEGSVHSHSNAEDSEENEEDKMPNMKFRNYLPHDKQLQEGKLTPAVLPKFEDPAAAVPPPPEKIEDPFVNIAPKKPNWDLRRDVQKKLDKLERRTQKAIYQLMQEQEKEKEALEAENGEAED
ncbi:coiled-coil domain-containing protein 12 [Phoenix dactylifera]|uniref:Coiled-coil domain-containing protein 12 n=1 Tax=Phoenix dactylifera TaxID=42345 RepID=A0A8B8JAC2_PHODC|nr:coiled-coil domain-containing protein 12 [Phoenix dactylifera]XP_026664272.1 coiled-coil domain-containing protein 12 [Phoenix dactylifera]